MNRRWREFALLEDDAGHMPVLTGLRGFAAFWVFLYHTWVIAGFPQFEYALGPARVDLTPLVAMGGAGVTIFFVLSGFLLSLPFVEWKMGRRARPAIGSYLLRRVARVIPAYYGQLAILLAVALLAGLPDRIPDAGGLLRHLAMLFLPAPLGTTPINRVWWTLPIEFSFYLLLPWLAVLLRAERWWLLLAGSLAAMWAWRHGVIVHLADEPLSDRVYSAYQLAGSFDMFGFGMCAALAYAHRDGLPAWFRRLLEGNRATVGGLVALAVAVYWLAANRQQYWADFPIFYLWTPLLSLGTVALILSGLLGAPWTRRLFANRIAIFAGVVSYSVYLWHLPVLELLAAVVWLPSTSGDRFAMLLFLSIPAVFAVATLSYVLIEAPFMKRRRAAAGQAL